MFKSLLTKSFVPAVLVVVICIAPGCSRQWYGLPLDSSAVRSDTLPESSAVVPAERTESVPDTASAGESEGSSGDGSAADSGAGDGSSAAADTAPSVPVHALETASAILKPLDVEILTDQESLSADDGSVLLNMAVSIPHIKNEDALSLEMINEFYESIRLNYVYDVKNRLLQDARQEAASLKGPLPAPYESRMESEVKYNIDGYLSVIRDSYEFAGESGSSTFRRAELFDVNTGESVPLWKLFTTPEDESRERLLSILTGLADDAVAGGTTYTGDYRDTIRTYFDPSNFYLSESGLVVFYQSNVLSDGYTEFVIPYDSIGDILAARITG